MSSAAAQTLATTAALLDPQHIRTSVFEHPVDVPDGSIDSELRVLLTHNQLPLEVLHAIVSEGFTTVELFGALASTEAGLTFREVLS